MDTNQDALRALIEAERQANIDGDVDAFMALRAPDFTAMPPGMLPIHGASAVRKFIAQSVQEGTVTELSFTTEDLRVSGDLAVARVTGNGSMQLDEGAEMKATLSFLFIARRSGADDWLWLHCAWNVLPSA